MAVAFFTAHSNAEGYDPMLVSKKEITSRTFSVKDAARKRELPIRIYFPKTKEAAPVILFSHGLGGSCDNNPYLGEHWAKRGYAVVFIQHPGSDESVWKDEARPDRMSAMKGAASIENFMDRMRDVPVVIDALEKWNAEAEADLAGKFDLKKIGMSGHSFGAKTTQALAGQVFRGGDPTFLEKRIGAAVMMSPSLPRMGDPAKAFGTIKVPCLLMTGTEDNGVLTESDAGERVKVFPNINAAPAWQVVFDGGEHSSFGELESPLKSGEKRFHKPILALTTAFWDANLLASKDAEKWLNGDGARGVLEEKDRWERNALAGE